MEVVRRNATAKREMEEARKRFAPRLSGLLGLFPHSNVKRTQAHWMTNSALPPSFNIAVREKPQETAQTWCKTLSLDWAQIRPLIVAHEGGTLASLRMRMRTGVRERMDPIPR
jgi:hypothetical protein